MPMSRPPADRKNPFDLSGHRAMITGGTQGVGAAIAIAVAGAGAEVLLVGLQEDDVARQTLASCRSLGVTAELLTVDLAQPPSQYLHGLVDDAERLMPGIDLVGQQRRHLHRYTFLRDGFRSIPENDALERHGGLFPHASVGSWLGREPNRRSNPVYRIDQWHSFRTGSHRLRHQQRRGSSHGAVAVRHTGATQHSCQRDGSRLGANAAD